MKISQEFKQGFNIEPKEVNFFFTSSTLILDKSEHENNSFHKGKDLFGNCFVKQFCNFKKKMFDKFFTNIYI